MEELRVKNIIIGKQFGDSENYKKILEIAKEKNIKIYVVEAGQKIKIEKNLYFNILWPSKKEYVAENPLNNNSLVCKLVYKNFSMLFTGDIEKSAEKEILTKYSENLNVLKAMVLKVAHHGSNTSTTQEFLDAVKPEIALIGVGKNNLFGHPSKSVLDKLKSINGKVYRTDEDGEITIFAKNWYKIFAKCR